MKVKTKYGSKTLACLIPSDRYDSGITCHEKTLCDCEVIEIVEQLEEANELIRTLSMQKFPLRFRELKPTVLAESATKYLEKYGLHHALNDTDNS